MQGSPDIEAQAFINVEKGVSDSNDALSGARDIIAEMLSENADIRSAIREAFAHDGIVVSKVVEGKNAAPTKFEQYYDYKEKVTTIPSHRYLAIRRGEREGVLDFQIDIEPEPVLHQIRSLAKLKNGSPFSEQLDLAIADSYKRLLLPSVETDVRVTLSSSPTAMPSKCSPRISGTCSCHPLWEAVR